MIRAMRTPRMRELVNLGYVGLLTAIGFLAVYTARQQDIHSTSLIYAGCSSALFVLLHLLVRACLPQADPFLLPLAALMAAIGLTEIYRIEPVLARDQGGVAHRRRRRCSSALIVAARPQQAGPLPVPLGGRPRLLLLVITMVAGTTVNGAKLWIRFGGFQHPAGRVRQAAARDLPRRLPAREAEVLTFAAPARARVRRARR